jgi:hypothetical protein
MLKHGKYSVWFKTPVGEGAGVVELEPTGQLRGGDGVASYTGTWEQNGERLKATISSKRTHAGLSGGVWYRRSRYHADWSLQPRWDSFLQGLRQASAGVDVGGHARPYR